MPKITFVDSCGEERDVQAMVGQSVMEAALDHMIPEIDADCGGACACATCHVYVDEVWTDKTGRPDAMEQSMLDFAQNLKSTSRLSCQVKVSEALDGLRVITPESQG